MIFIKPDIHEFFNTSNFSKDNPFGIEAGINKKIVGKFKVGEKQIKEFVGLRSKLYCFTTDADKEEKKCKGVKNM